MVAQGPKPPSNNYERFWGAESLSSNMFSARYVHSYAIDKEDERKVRKEIATTLCWLSPSI